MARAALKLRVIGAPSDPTPDYIALRRVASEELQPIYDTNGTATETRRRVNVFLQWRDTGATDDQKRDARSLSGHGISLMAIYAKAHGVAGGRDRSLYDYIDNDEEPDRDWQQYFRIVGKDEATRHLAAILSQVGALSGTVLTSLCHDWFFGDGRSIERANGRREAPWRSVVRESCKKYGKTISTSNEESLIVWEALVNLKHANWARPERPLRS